MRRRSGFRLVAVVLGAVLAFAAAEVIVRLTLPPVDLHVLAGLPPAADPMARWARVDAFCAYRAIPRHTHLFGRGKTANRDGFMSTPEIEPHKPPATLRLAFLGGSSTACTSPPLPDAQTWPWRAAEHVRRALPERHVDFINGALPGYSTFESYGRLWSRIRFFRPDVVVVYHGWNDMYYFRDAGVLRDWRVGEGGDWAFASRPPLVPIQPLAIDPWLGWSNILCRVRRAWFSEPLAGEVGGPPRAQLAADFDPRGPEVFRENLRLFLRAQEVLGFRLFVVKQATMIVPGLSAELRARCSVQFHGFDFDAHVRAFAAIYRVIDEEVPPPQVIDATSLSGDPEVLNDHVHLSSAGAARLAELVAARLIADRAAAAAPPQGR